MNEPAGRQVGLNDGVHSAAPCQLLSGGRAPTENSTPKGSVMVASRAYTMSSGSPGPESPRPLGRAAPSSGDRGIGDRSVTPLALSLVDDRTHLTLYREIGERGGEADALNGVGATHHATGHHDQAHAYHAAALTLASQIGDRYEQARAHDGLARTHHASGELDQTRHHWYQAQTSGS